MNGMVNCGGKSTEKIATSNYSDDKHFNFAQWFAPREPKLLLSKLKFYTSPVCKGQGSDKRSEKLA